jgi:hypothetical protein
MYLQMMQQASLLRPACCTSWAWARAGCSSPRATPIHFVKHRRRRVVWYLALRWHVAHERSEREVSEGVCLLEFYTE